MKKNILTVCVAFFLTGGCGLLGSDSEPAVLEEFEIVEVNLKQGQEYTFNLGAFGDEEYPTMEKEPDYAELSDFFWNVNEKGAVTIDYKYIPQAAYSGKDYVIIESKRGSDGESPNPRSLFTVIRFQVDAD